MAKKKDDKSSSFTYGDMQSGADFKSKEKNATDSDNTNSHEQKTLSAENSKKKRRRNRGKSEPNTSRTETQTTAEYEKNKLACSNTFLKSFEMQKLIAARISAIESGTNKPKSIVPNQKYKIIPSSLQENQKSTCSTKDENVQDSSKDKLGFVFDNKCKIHDSINPVKKDISAEFDGHKLDCLDSFLDKGIDMRELFKARASAIESGRTEPKSVTCMQKHKTKCSLAEKGKRKVAIATKGENVANPFKENPVTISNVDSSTYSFNRPVIFVRDKSTQTDPFLETEKVLKHKDAEIIAAPNTGSDFALIIEATETDLLLPPEKSNLENISKGN